MDKPLTEYINSFKDSQHERVEVFKKHCIVVLGGGRSTYKIIKISSCHRQILKLQRLSTVRIFFQIKTSCRPDDPFHYEAMLSRTHDLKVTRAQQTGLEEPADKFLRTGITLHIFHWPEPSHKAQATTNEAQKCRGQMGIW